MYYPHIYLGKILPYEGSSPSAIAKCAVKQQVILNALGLEGDEQAEKKVHGGPDRALCHYPREHYDHWRAQYPTLHAHFQAPAFGENISTIGLTEENVYIGDIFRWGNALIQVTQPRSPCYKLNYHFGIHDLSEIMQNSGKCGWLYRVVSTGEVGPNQPLELLSHTSNVSVAEAIAIAFHMPFDQQRCQRLLSAAGLSASWSKTMQMRLLNEKIEDFSYRLTGMRPTHTR